MTLVTTRTSEPFALRVIDSTGNHLGWEHGVTSALYGALKSRGIPLSGDLHQPTTMADTLAALAAEPQYNALLLVTHGSPALKNDAAQVRLADSVVPWHLFSQTDHRLDNKAIFLAICFGANEDSRFALETDGHMALVVVGSEVSLSSDEVVQFFPPFLAELAEQQQSGLVRETVELLVTRYTSLSNRKMMVLV